MGSVLANDPESRNAQQDRPGDSPSGSVMRNLARVVALLAIGIGIGIGLVPSPARAAAVEADLLEEPCYATCGQYRWFLNHRIEIRENADCCIPFIKKAKKKEEQALELYEASGDPSLESWEQLDLLREGNKMIGRRTRLIRKFTDCVNGVIHAWNMMEQGFDPTAIFAETCRVSSTCELPE